MIKYLPILLFVGFSFWGCEDSNDEDTTPPTVSISSPVSGQGVNEIVTIVVSTQDNDGVSRVEFLINDSLVFTDSESPYEYQWNTTQYESNSEHTVKVISYDNSNNSTESQPILLIIDNSSSYPTSSILYPISYYDGFQIKWSKNNDADFQSYMLYESLSESMNNQILVYQTTEIEDTNYVVTENSENMYYQLITTDIVGLESHSNIEVTKYQVELWGEYYLIDSTTSLTLSNNQISGIIPPQIGNLINLTYLGLYENAQLTGSIPPEIGNLTNLNRLELGSSQLSGSIPSEIGNLTNLTMLGLSHNQFTGTIPPEIGNLTNLNSLRLFNNQLTGEIPSEIGNLTNLWALELKDNQLTGEIPVEIGNLTNLNSLGLSNNQLTGEIPSGIFSFTGMSHLHLNNNQLTGEIPLELFNIDLWNPGSINNLNLSFNNLSGSISPEIGNLTFSNDYIFIIQIKLNDNQLSGIIPEEICDLHFSSSVTLENNNLCPPYPSCIEDYVGEQDTSNCGD